MTLQVTEDDGWRMFLDRGSWALSVWEPRRPTKEDTMPLHEQVWQVVWNAGYIESKNEFAATGYSPGSSLGSALRNAWTPFPLAMVVAEWYAKNKKDEDIS